MLSVFCSPLRYVQGVGAMRRLGAEIVAVGLEGPVLIVAGATPIARLAPTWAAALDAVGMSHRVRLFGGESSRREIAAIAEEAKSLGARTIVAAGGGKVLDAARSAAAGLRLPFVSCPTVCSTDAPTSGRSVIDADSGPQRGSVEVYEIHRRSPHLVLVDTQAIAESPPAWLAAAHAVHNGLAAIAATHDAVPGEKVAFGTLVHLLLEANAATDAAVREATLAEAEHAAAFFTRIGLPVTLGELGIDAEGGESIAVAVNRIAVRATQPGETIHNMPFPVDAVSVATAIHAADDLGRAALRAGASV